jgi:hypothetical protein
MAPRFVLVGNPDNRRVTLFQAALARQGLPPARMLAWLELAADDGAARLASLVPEHAPSLLRLDAAGESFAVERELLRLGYEPALALGSQRRSEGDEQSADPHVLDPVAIVELTEQRGRVLCPRQAQLGFERLLHRVAAVCAERPACQVLDDPATVAELFDKRRTSTRYQAAGIPIPDRLPRADEIHSPEVLRAAVREQGWSSVYVKLACGSSASCLLVYRQHGGGRESILTSLEARPSALYNSLRLSRYDDRQTIDRLLTFVLTEGAQIERAIPKARLAGAPFDLRVLVVCGEPVFEVIRQSRHPITNLHLGGWRGDPAALDAALPKAPRRAAEASCRAVAALHPGASRIGVDLLYEPGFGAHRIIEANAFGDLLPGLERDGLDVYQWQIAAALAQR